MQKTFNSTIDRLQKLKLNHITISKDVLEELADQGEKSIYNQRFIVTINDTITWHAGSVSLGNDSAYITFSSARMKKLGVHLGDTVKVSLEKDRSKYGFEVPVEFEEVLEQDPEAKQRFDALTMGFQRNIIYLIIQYKTVDKRIEKSLFFMENLKKSPIGKTTMRHILGKDIP